MEKSDFWNCSPHSQIPQTYETLSTPTFLLIHIPDYSINKNNAGLSWYSGAYKTILSVVRMILNIKTLFLINPCPVIMHNATITAEYDETFELLDIEPYLFPSPLFVFFIYWDKKHSFHGKTVILKIAQQITCHI